MIQFWPKYFMWARLKAVEQNANAKLYRNNRILLADSHNLHFLKSTLKFSIWFQEVVKQNLTSQWEPASHSPAHTRQLSQWWIYLRSVNESLRSKNENSDVNMFVDVFVKPTVCVCFNQLVVFNSEHHAENVPTPIKHTHNAVQIIPPIRESQWAENAERDLLLLLVGLLLQAKCLNL